MFPIIISAQWSTDPSENLQVSTWGVVSQACTDGNGGAFVMWSSNNHQYLQRVDRHGFIIWDNPIFVGGEWDIQDPHGAKIIANGLGSAFIGYNDALAVDTIGNYIIYKSKAMLQCVDSSGNKLWGEHGIQINPDTTVNQGLVDIIPDEDGGVIVMYAEGDDYYSDMRILLYRISYEGEYLWGDGGVLVYDGEEPEPIKIISDGIGGAIVYYEVTLDTWFKRIDSQGNILWLSPNGTFGVHYLESDENGGCVMSGARSLGFVEPYGTIHAIIANKIDSNGVFPWGIEGITIADTVYYTDRYADICFNIDSSVSYAWRNSLNQSNIFTQTVQSDGSFMYIEEGIPITLYISQKGRPDITSSGVDHIFVWPDTMNNGGLYSQKLGFSGIQLWDTTDVILTSRDYYRFTVITDQNGGIIVVFNDEPFDGVFAQQVSRNGNLGEVLPVMNVGEASLSPTLFTLYQNYPNPFNSVTAIKYELLKESYISIEIYNIIGQRVKELISEVQPAGYHTVVWNGTNFKDEFVVSGVYIYTLHKDDLTIAMKMLVIK